MPKPVINQLTAITYGNSQTVNAVSSYMGGIAKLEVFNSRGDLLHGKDCKGQVVCTLDLTLNNITQKAMTVNVWVTAIDGSQDSEMLTATFEDNTARVFSVTKVGPDVRSISAAMVDMEGEESVTIGVAPVPIYTGGDAPLIRPGTTEFAPPGSERISFSTQDLEPNKKRIVVQGHAPEGLDFLELLEDGVFVDVTLCRGRTTCALERTVERPQGGSYLYLVKLQIKDGALHTYSQRLNYGPGPQQPEPEPTDQE